MKLFEKFKDMFTEVIEEEEVKVEQVPVKVKQEPVVIDSFDEVKVEKEEVKKPVFFTDHDFEDMKNMQNSRVEKEENKKFQESYNQSRSSYREVKNEVREAYQGNQTLSYNDPYKAKKEERVFKPTPIISPVYGILDKNYSKDDIVTKKEVSYTKPVDGLSVDSVRKKAYGTLEDELENTLFGSNSILFNNKEEAKDETDDFFGELEEEARPDLLDDFEVNEDYNDKKIKDLEEITMDIGKELDSLINKKENIKSREEKNKNIEEDDDLFNLIDTMYEGDDEVAN